MVFDPAGWWAMLNSGNIFGAVLASWTGTMGDWFYLIVVFMGMTMIYLKTQDFGTTTGIGMLIAIIAMPFLPVSVGSLIFVFIVLGFSIIAYRVFH